MDAPALTDPIGANKPMPCRILDINVNDGKINWSSRDGGGENENYRAGNADLKLEDYRRDSIELLFGLLQLLVDVTPRADDQVLRVDRMLYQLAINLGREMYEVLFENTILEQRLRDALFDIRNGHLELLRIELEFAGIRNQELASWPWEYLYMPEDPRRPGGGIFLAMSSQLVLNRSLSFDPPLRFSTPKPTMLLVISRPRGLGEVLSEVQETINQLKAAELIDLQELIEPEPGDLLDQNYRPTASWEKFEQMVKDHSPHIIHFIGHGRLSYDQTKRSDTGELAFVGDDGTEQWVNESRFANAVVNRNLSLVFLQACESALSDPRANISGVAKLLAQQNIPAVIAMQAKLKNKVANIFAAKFYDMLSQRAPIDIAVKAGREAIGKMRDLSDSQKLAFGIPVVYLNTYDGLIERSAEPGTRQSRVIPLLKRPTLEFCPNCAKQLNDSARQKNACPGCNLQLRCTCDLPLDYPDVNGCYCGECRAIIPPLKRDESSATALPATPRLSFESDHLIERGPEARDLLGPSDRVGVSGSRQPAE